MRRKSLIKLAVNIFVALWGMLTFFLIAGEESLNEPVSDATFVVVKLVALCSLVVLAIFCKYANKKGLL